MSFHPPDDPSSSSFPLASTSSQSIPQNATIPLSKRRGTASHPSRQQLRADGGFLGGPMIQIEDEDSHLGEGGLHGHRKGRSGVAERWLDRWWPDVLPFPPGVGRRRDSFASPDRAGGYRLSKGGVRRKSISMGRATARARWGRIWGLRRNPLVVWPLVIALIISVIWGTIYVRNIRANYHTHLEVKFKLKMDKIQPPFKWAQEPPLAGCFDPSRVRSTSYNLSALHTPKTHLVSSGTGLRTGMSCHDFSNTIQPIPSEPLSHLTYHTYWRADLHPFQSRQAATVKSFLATQPLSHSRLIIWSNSAANLSSNPHIQHFVRLYPENVLLKQVDMVDLARGTALEGMEVIGSEMFDVSGWVDGDAVRLLVLWKMGGVWMDMDMLLTRDLHPLTEHEFVIRWDCEDRHWLMLNGALMHFRQHSPYLCEAFHIMSTSPPPDPNSITWGAYLYQTLYVRLLASHITPFSVLPWCFADPMNCDEDIRFPDPFAPDPETWLGLPWAGERGVGARKELEARVGQIWAVHLHNQWTKEFPKGGWVERLLDGYEAQLVAMEKFGSLAAAGAA